MVKKKKLKKDKASSSFGIFAKKSKSMFSKGKERAEAEGAGLLGLEDGYYIVRLTNCELGKSQSSGRMQAMFEWTVVEGEHKGDKHREYQGINSEDNIVYLNKRLMRLGYDSVGSFEELEEIISNLLKEKPGARIQVATRGDFTNVYIKKVLGDEDLPDDEIDDETEDEEEPPTPSNVAF